MKKSIAIIGGGPSSLALAAFLNSEKFDVTIYEKNKSTGRKFLVAGKGGFNLTHSEDIEQMITRYSEHPFVSNAIRSFTNDDLREWLGQIGVPTFVGSSKRVYPLEGIKPIEVLNKILAVLNSKGAKIRYEHCWKGWNEKNELVFESGNVVSADYTIFALGGGSWKVTGSDGLWLDTFAKKGIKTAPFLPANCAYEVDWESNFLPKNEGQPLKNISLNCSNKTSVGELVITQFGLEGNAIYALSGEIQNQLSNEGKSTIYLDMKPMISDSDILEKLTRSNSKTTDLLRKKLKLSKPLIDLLKSYLSKDEFLDKTILARNIKHFPIVLTAAAPIDEAISTTGGILLSEITEKFEFRNFPNTFCIGEMLDWNAPTGGYLLQACFSMGVTLALQLNQVKE